MRGQLDRVRSAIFRVTVGKETPIRRATSDLLPPVCSSSSIRYSRSTSARVGGRPRSVRLRCKLLRARAAGGALSKMAPSDSALLPSRITARSITLRSSRTLPG